MSTRRSFAGRALAALSFAVLVPLCAAAQELRLEQAIGSVFPSNLTASPEGAGFAWVFNDRGVRNVWYAQAPGFDARKLTAFDADDGQGGG